MTHAVGIVIGHYDHPVAVELNVACIRDRCGNVPILVRDDSSPPAIQDAVRQMCQRWEATFISNPRRAGHSAGDVAVFYEGLLWASSLQLPVLFKVSQRFVCDIQNWAQDATALLLASGQAAIGRPYYGIRWLRTEAIGLRVSEWSSPPVLAELSAGNTRRGRPVACESTIYNTFMKHCRGRLLEWPSMSAHRDEQVPGILFRMPTNCIEDYQALGARLGVTVPDDFDLRDSNQRSNYRR